MKNIIILFLILFSLNGAMNNVYAKNHSQTKNSISKAIVKVNGMVCDFCARGLDKTLGKNKAVHKLNISLENGTVEIIFKNHKILSENIIKKIISDNGVSVVSIKYE